MINSAIAKTQDENQDRAIWIGLRKAIAKSSGFKRWQQEKNLQSADNLDVMVRRYLEETLATLAY